MPTRSCLYSKWSPVAQPFCHHSSQLLSIRSCQGTLRRFRRFRPFRPLHTFTTFPCLYSSSPSLKHISVISIDFRVFPLFHFYLSFHFPLSFYSLFFSSLFLSRVPLFSVLFIV